MKDINIRKMPKYIFKKIQKFDKVLYPEQKGNIRFYAYLSIWNKELVKVTVAVKNKYKIWYCKQVAVHGLNFDKCYVKDMEYCNYMSMGFKVGWHAEGLSKYPTYYESKEWQYADDKYYDPYAKIINLEIIDLLPQFKYSAYKLYNDVDILNYLRLYLKYPQTEYLLKLGLNKLVKSKLILKQINKDKNFIKWLSKNRQEIIDNYFYIPSIIKAYKTGNDLKMTQCFSQNSKLLQKENTFNYLKELFKDKNFEQLFCYIYKQKTSLHIYNDYIDACTYLNSNLNLEKNLFPKNFNRAHELCTMDFEKAKNVENQIAREKLKEQFYSIANKYSKLQKIKNDFSIILPKSPYDLKLEGSSLNHCVGRMDYDKKFINEESLILFLRRSQAKEKPFVTIEFSLKNKSILQCYGSNNSKPDDTVINFVNKIWLPYAKRKISKINA